MLRIGDRLVEFAQYRHEGAVLSDEGPRGATEGHSALCVHRYVCSTISIFCSSRGDTCGSVIPCHLAQLFLDLICDRFAKRHLLCLCVVNVGSRGLRRAEEGRVRARRRAEQAAHMERVLVRTGCRGGASHGRRQTARLDHKQALLQRRYAGEQLVVRDGESLVERSISRLGLFESLLVGGAAVELAFGVDEGEALHVDLLQARDAVLQRRLHLDGLSVVGHGTAGAGRLILGHGCRIEAENLIGIICAGPTLCVIGCLAESRQSLFYQKHILLRCRRGRCRLLGVRSGERGREGERHRRHGEVGGDGWPVLEDLQRFLMMTVSLHIVLYLLDLLSVSLILLKKDK